MPGDLPERAQHWTERLFGEHAEIYVPFLEGWRDRGEQEARALESIFAELGVPGAGKVLDLACGIGRHSVPLAWSYQVVGLDMSSTFVERAGARAKTERLSAQFVVGRMEDPSTYVAPLGPFNAVINMFTSMGYYGRDADLVMLRQARSMAAPGAVLVLDTINRDWLVRHFSPSGVAEAGGTVILEARRFDLERSLSESTWTIFSRDKEDLRFELRVEVSVRVYSLHELAALMEEAGWRFVRGHGVAGLDNAFELAAPTFDSQRLWVIGQA